MPNEVTFTLHNHGGPHVFKLEGDTPGDLLEKYHKFISQSENDGFSTVPPDPSLQPKFFRIMGYVIGEANRKGGGIQKCAFLYNDILAFQYKVATVYEEWLPLLPLGDLDRVKLWQGESAPSRQTAINKQFLNPCDFEIILKPVVDFRTGKAKVTEKDGKTSIKYKMGGVTRINKYPPQTFVDERDALEWGLETKLFSDQKDVEAKFKWVKSKAKPERNEDMWRAWLEYCNGLLADRDQGDE